MIHEQRPASADKTSEDQGQVENHSAEDIQAYGTDEELINLVDAKRQRIKFPPANEKELWEALECRIIHKLDKLIGKSTLSHKLDTFGDIVYQTSLEMFGPKTQKAKEPPRKNRRQREMEALRKRKKNLKRQMKTATTEEQIGLKSIWRDLQARHTALSRAESARKKRSLKKKKLDQFFQDPFNFARKLFEQPKSGSLVTEKNVLEDHLRKTYSDPERQTPLPDISGLVWPSEPGEKFNCEPPSLKEVAAVIRKARNKSAPGPNGVPYLLYKRCPKVLTWLHKILKSAWKNLKISDQWTIAEGVYIPKEQNSSEINQFRPISLLNVEGKIFFSVMASRLTKYLKDNGYINVSVQKGGIPGVSGCLEHASMIWEAIQRAKSEKLDLDVVWLDLANAYGSVPHQMIQLALKMYHVPEGIQIMLEEYFAGFKMRYSTESFTTDWINLEVGIAMGCTISPILFVMAMEIILKASEQYASPTDLGDGCEMHPLKAFMDDTTIMCSKEEETRRMLTRMDELMTWCRMSFKPKKSRSLSIRKGKVNENVIFQVASQNIPTVTEEPVKSLGRWYDASLKDTKRGLFLSYYDLCLYMRSLFQLSRRLTPR